MDDDLDSQDSNREDHEQNEYPEDMEQSDDEEDPYRNRSDGQSSNGYGQEGRNDSDGGSEDEKMEHDGAGGEKKKKLKNSIFDKIFKKNKDWSYQNHLSQFKDTGFLDEYE